MRAWCAPAGIHSAPTIEIRTIEGLLSSLGRTSCRSSVITSSPSSCGRLSVPAPSHASRASSLRPGCRYLSKAISSAGGSPRFLFFCTSCRARTEHRSLAASRVPQRLSFQSSAASCTSRTCVPVSCPFGNGKYIGSSQLFEPRATPVHGPQRHLSYLFTC